MSENQPTEQDLSHQWERREYSAVCIHCGKFEVNGFEIYAGTECPVRRDKHDIAQLRAENDRLKARKDELEKWMLKAANGTGAEISNTERAVSSSQIERLSNVITQLRAENESLKQQNKELREALEKIKQEASRPLNGQSTRAMRILDYAEAALATKG